MSTLTARGIHVAFGAREVLHGVDATIGAGDRVGLVGPVLLLVVHTWPEKSEEGEPVGRIISARKATAHERKAYEEGNF